MRVSDLDLRDISSRLIISVMNYEENADRLDSYPFVIKGDMAVVCQLCVGQKNKEGLYTSCLTVTNELLNKWDLDKDTLFSLATKNGKDLMKPSIEQISKEKDDEFGLNFNYVLTNSYHFNGASSLFYDSGMIQRIGEKAVLLPVSSNEIYVIAPVPQDNEEQFINNVDGIYQEFRQKTNSGLSAHALIFDRREAGVLTDTEGNSFHPNLNEYMFDEKNDSSENVSMSAMTR